MAARVFALKIGVAPDSFKGSLSALEAATCIEAGLKRALGGISVVKVPMADGGEGTVNAIVESTGGRIVHKKVKGPREKPVRAAFGLSGDGKTAVIEMAAASGLALLAPRERNPKVTTTYGTGQLIKKALDLGARKILVGIGGSATNDGGTGMARALGVKFFDGRDNPLPEGGGSLKRLSRIDMSGLDARIVDSRVEVACDVDNPLYGPKGAAHVYAPQKGASPAAVAELDAGLRRFAEIVHRDVGVPIARAPGSGAAGGLGGGLMAFLDGALRPGVDIVTDSVRLEKRLAGCHFVITGEGRMDGQTAFGKTPSGVAKVARKLGIPVIAICGSLGPDAGAVHKIGIAAYFAALEESVDEADLAKRGPDMLTRCAEQVGRLLALDFLGRNSLRLRPSR